MKFKVIEQPLYCKALKKISKKYKHIDKDIDLFLNKISTKSDIGIELKNNIFKTRIANSDKNKGKSGGCGLISYLAIINEELHLLYIYDRSQLTNLSEKELDNLILEQII